jgi:hypothetical protein
VLAILTAHAIERQIDSYTAARKSWFGLVKPKPKPTPKAKEPQINFRSP